MKEKYEKHWLGGISFHLELSTLNFETAADKTMSKFVCSLHVAAESLAMPLVVPCDKDRMWCK